MTTTANRHVLALANAPTDNRELLDAVRQATRNRLDARVLVVAPALNSRIRHWASDSAEAVEAARERLRVCVRHLTHDGIQANGMIGDPDPAQALTDALAVFPADALVIVTQPEARSNWLAKNLVERVRRSCDLEIVNLTSSSNDPAEHSLAARLLTREEPTMHNELNRRDVLKSVGGVGLAAVFGARALDLLGGDAEAATTCLLTPEVTEGPYWVEYGMTRRNITEGKAGLPLVIRFTVLNAKTCKPIKNADVEIWHCDALGNYSAVNGATTRFLRGHQKSNAAGKAEFLTIFPGWYRGRTPHIHMKVSVGGNAVHTGQIFFNEKITAAVYKLATYASHGQYDTSHSRDNIYHQAGGSTAELKLTKRTGGLKGYLGTIAIGVVT